MGLAARDSGIDSKEAGPRGPNIMRKEIKE
jgi:hypothetical protein